MTVIRLAQIERPEYYDVARALRNIADEIERGEYGDVISCGVALLGDALEVFGAGPDSEPPMVAMLFNAGALRFAKNLEAGFE